MQMAEASPDADVGDCLPCESAGLAVVARAERLPMKKAPYPDMNERVVLPLQSLLPHLWRDGEHNIT